MRNFIAFFLSAFPCINILLSQIIIIFLFYSDNIAIDFSIYGSIYAFLWLKQNLYDLGFIKVNHHNDVIV